MSKLPLLALFVVPSVLADVASPKTYSGLFTPVAIEDRRALSIDRSNFTYGPTGIDSGVLQVEFQPVDYVYDNYNSAGVRAEQFTYGVTSVRLGLTKNCEAGFIFGGYVDSRVTDHATGVVTKAHGIGDCFLQSRYTFTGYDGETVASAIMPYVKLPTSQLGNGKIEFGTQVPLAYAFGDTPFSVAVAPGFDMLYKGASGGFTYDFQPFLGTAFWYAATDRLSFFNEYVVKKNTGTGTDDVTAFVAVGATYVLTANSGVDVGVNYGLTKETPDWDFRVGYTFRY